jgi:mono/diheme cytochrome c family protein
MRYFIVIFLFSIVAGIGILGFRGDFSQKPPIEVFPDMDRMARYKPQAGDTDKFWADGRQDRPPVPGTIATIPAHLEIYAKYDTTVEDDYLATGKNQDGSFGKGFPVEVNAEFMALGHEKFQIFCSRCHGTVGDGNGITKKYGMIATPSYHDDRIRNMPEGEIFNTITHGKNLMGPYGAKLRYNERWAIVAYVRALQRAQTATINDVPQQNRKELDL